MKYLLIAIMVVGVTAQAKPFSMADYAATTGKIPVKKTGEADISYTEKLTMTQASVDKKRKHLKDLIDRKNQVGIQYHEQLEKLRGMIGDMTKSRELAAKARKSRLFTLDSEIRKTQLKIASLYEHLAYYRHMIKGEEMFKKLKV